MSPKRFKVVLYNPQAVFFTMPLGCCWRLARNSILTSTK